MQISSRFTIAVHIFACIDTFGRDHKITSEFLASSVNVNPVIIRNILSQLKKAGLVQVQRGSGGTTISKPMDQITFYDIYQAVDSIEQGNLFHFHEKPNPNCPVGRNIHAVLDPRLDQVQKAMEKELKSITLADIKNDLQKQIHVV